MKKPKIDKYFLTETCPYSGKRKINTKTATKLGIVLVVALVGFVLFFGSSKEKKQPVDGALIAKSTEGPQKAPGTDNAGSITVGNWGGSYVGTIPTRSAGSSRQYTSSQLVKASEGQNLGQALPMGSTFEGRLVNTILSSDSVQPVIAEIGEDIFWKNSVFIPAGTRAIGGASFDDTARRLQIRFQTFVFPGGDQHAVSALALLPDGSSGLPGDYHSGETMKQTGRFAGTFIGGLAEGMKDKQPGGGMGMPLEPGSLKNGLLNGLAMSALDQSKRFSDDLQKVKPYLEIPAGSTFLLYLEKEFQP